MDTSELEATQNWFSEHVMLDGQPYTLDQDQVRAVLDDHKNTLVTARAGSGKTRVIVAKITYLVAQKHLHLSEITAFMFNRIAAAEVNARIASVTVDGKTLPELDRIKKSSRKSAKKSSSKSAQTSSGAEDTPSPQATDDLAETSPSVTVASTFHKFALDVAHLAGKNPQIIDEPTAQSLIIRAFDEVTQGQKLTPAARRDQIRLVASFISRAGQRFCGQSGPKNLQNACANILAYTTEDYTLSPAERKKLKQQLSNFYHTAFRVYCLYLDSLTPPKTDFNRLMSDATGYLFHSAKTSSSPLAKHFAPLKYILIDEYQDFSFLFFAIIQALRANCPEAHLFAVGDDWQAINRFAGSDVDYFLNFATYFPDDHANIPLMTNYRSAQSIVEHANDFMLKHYDRRAQRAVAFNKEQGKIKYGNPRLLKFDATDIDGDALDDGRFQLALLHALPDNIPVDRALLKRLIPAAKLLKRTVRIIKDEYKHSILLLHRHNFTSVQDVTLSVFRRALTEVLVEDELLTPEQVAENIRVMTIHKSKGLEAEVVILLEANHEMLLGHHADVDLFRVFGDNSATERADQQRLIYVALTRAKNRLYILSSSRHPPC